MIKKAEDTEIDTAEQSAIKLRAQQQTSNALVVTDQRPANGTPLANHQLGLVKIPTTSSNVVSLFPLNFSFWNLRFLFQIPEIIWYDRNGVLQDYNSTDQGLSQENGNLSKADPQTPSPDLLGDLLGPLAIEGPPGTAVQSHQNVIPGSGGDPTAADATAIVPVGEEPNSVQVLFFKGVSGGCVVASEYYDVGDT